MRKSIFTWLKKALAAIAANFAAIWLFIMTNYCIQKGVQALSDVLGVMV